MARPKKLTRDLFIEKQLQIPIETLQPDSTNMLFPLATVVDAAEVRRLRMIGQRRMVRAGAQEWDFEEVYDVRIIEEILEDTVHLIKYGNTVVGTCRISFARDEEYETLDEGAWTDPDAPYMTVSRIACERVWDQCRSVGRSVMIFARMHAYLHKINHIRVHVSEQNTAMIARLERSNYRRVGRLTLKDGRKRIAYEKVYPPQEHRCPPRNVLDLP